MVLSGHQHVNYVGTVHTVDYERETIHAEIKPYARDDGTILAAVDMNVFGDSQLPAIKPGQMIALRVLESHNRDSSGDVALAINLSRLACDDFDMSMHYADLLYRCA